LKQTLSTSLIGILALSLLSACGGGSGDDEPASAISADSLASPASTEASQASTEGSVSSSLTAADLQRNAADNVAINLESSLGSVERLFNDVMPMVDDFAGESGGAESADAGAEAGSMIDNVNIIPDNPDIAPMMDDAESAAGSFMLPRHGSD